MFISSVFFVFTQVHIANYDIDREYNFKNTFLKPLIEQIEEKRKKEAEERNQTMPESNVPIQYHHLMSISQAQQMKRSFAQWRNSHIPRIILSFKHVSFYFLKIINNVRRYKPVEFRKQKI